MSNNANLTIEELFQTYVKKCIIKNLSERTIKNYQRIIANSHVLLVVQLQLMKSIAIPLMILFFILEKNNNCNGITINSYLRSIRAFLYFCMDGGYLEQFTIHIPKVDKKIKETYTEQELKLLLKKPDIKQCNFKEYQMWVFSNYLLATGNRISSELNLQIKDLDFFHSHYIF